MLVGVLVLSAIQVLYTSYFADIELFIDGIQLMLLAFVGYFGGNFLMLRRNNDKIKYIKQGLLFVLGTVGILIGIILRVA